MPIPLEDIAQSGAAGNLKAYLDQGAYQLYAMNGDSQFHNNQLKAISTQHFNGMSQVSLAVTTTSVAALTKLSLPEAAGLRQLDPATAQIALKGAQTSNPETGK